MNFTPTESLQLFTRVCRIFDSVSCTYTGEARSDVYGTLGWLRKLGPRDDPELQPLLDAIQHAWNSHEPWESRCQKLSQTIPPLEMRVLTLFGDGSMG
jgi:hypothetical protein